MKYIYNNAEDLASIVLAITTGQIDMSVAPIIIRLTLGIFDLFAYCKNILK